MFAGRCVSFVAAKLRFDGFGGSRQPAEAFELGREKFSGVHNHLSGQGGEAYSYFSDDNVCFIRSRAASESFCGAAWVNSSPYSCAAVRRKRICRP